MSKHTSQGQRLALYITGIYIHTLGQMSDLFQVTFIDDITTNLNNIFSNQIQKQKALQLFDQMVHNSYNSSNKSLETFNENKNKLITLLES